MKPQTKATDTSKSLYPGQPGFRPHEAAPVGGVLLGDAPIPYNCDRRTVKLTVRNTGDRPIQIGSHFHFFEVNRYMQFDRAAAFGCHLNIPATTALRFEPGDEKEVELVPFAGKCRIIGFNGLTRGFAGDEDKPGFYPVRLRALARVERYGFATLPTSTH
jgi:urease subunit beta